MKQFVLAMVALLVLFGSTEAAPILRFDNPTVDGGTLSYDGSGGPLIGTNIVFQNVISENTPLNSGVELFCVSGSCLLNFATGPNILEGGLLYTFGGGGTFTLTGTLNTAADGSGTEVASGVLISGTFDNPVVGLAGSDLLISAFGDDVKNQDLLDYYGLSNPFEFGHTDIAADYTQGANGSLTAVVSESDIVNTGKVPWSASLLMVGMGALLMGVTRLRKS